MSLLANPLRGNHGTNAFGCPAIDRIRHAAKTRFILKVQFHWSLVISGEISYGCRHQSREFFFELFLTGSVCLRMLGTRLNLSLSVAMQHIIGIILRYLLSQLLLGGFSNAAGNDHSSSFRLPTQLLKQCYLLSP